MAAQQGTGLNTGQLAAAVGGAAVGALIAGLIAWFNDKRRWHRDDVVRGRDRADQIADARRSELLEVYRNLLQHAYAARASLYEAWGIAQADVHGLAETRDYGAYKERAREMLERWARL